MRIIKNAHIKKEKAAFAFSFTCFIIALLYFLKNFSKNRI